MFTFRKLLFAQSELHDQRLMALAALTRISPRQLVEMTHGLTWQPW